jgi:hypothetical protein
MVTMVTTGYLLWLNIGYLVDNQLATLTQYKGTIKHRDNQLPHPPKKRLNFDLNTFTDNKMVKLQMVTLGQ